MTFRGTIALVCTFMILLLTLPAGAQQTELRGIVVKHTTPLAGATVVVNETGEAASTDRQGRFTLRVAPGVYTLTVTIGSQVTVRENVRVDAGAPAAALTIDVPFDIGFVDSITVESASRRPERIIDAPAAITVVPPEVVALGAPAGQLPRLVRGGLGIEAPQSSLYDFNVNTRGVNGYLTRRIQTTIDGRDPSNPVTSATEWWNLDLFADDVASVELARGPSAALYGPNSFNGVLNITTLAPRESPGGLVRITGGSLDTMKLQGRWAGAVGRHWFVKAIGQRTVSDDSTVSRDQTVEYAGLPQEAVPLERKGLDFNAGNIRLDRDAGDGRLLTFEGGIAEGSGAVLMTPASRGQQRDTRWTWLRANYHTPSWNVSSSYNDRVGDAVLLAIGGPLIAKGRSFAAEAQRHDQHLGGRLRTVSGVSYTRRWIDSADATGAQTLFVRPITSDQGALFGQFDYDVAPRVKLVGAVRYDESTLHDAQVSPKVSAVLALTPSHRLRLGFNRAFQVPTYTELFINIPASPPLDLSAVEAPLAPLLGGASLGFAAVPVRVVGNEDLRVEQVRALEAGYSGVLGGRLFLTADYYENRMHDFISGFLPGVNPAFAPYRLPDSIPRPIADAFESAVNAAIPGLTADSAGQPEVVLSLVNFGEASARGIETSAEYFAGAAWRVHASYTWFHFTAHEELPVAPNAPVHSVKAGGTYARGRLTATMGVRWTDAFQWSSGVFTGPVPSYTVADLSAKYSLTPHVQVGLTVDNVFDHVHYEMFGGNLIGRFALAYLSTTF